MANTMSDSDDATEAQTGPEKQGEPLHVGTVEEPCYGCGVVQEMTVKEQRYENNPPTHFGAGECPVCGNDHAANPPWRQTDE